MEKQVTLTIKGENASPYYIITPKELINDIIGNVSINEILYDLYYICNDAIVDSDPDGGILEKIPS